MPLFTPTDRGFARCCCVLVLSWFALPLAMAQPAAAAPWRGYDLLVAPDGSGDFTSIAQAVQSIPRGRRERTIIFIKNGVYHERVSVGAACVTLKGESREGTRIEFPIGNDPDYHGGSNTEQIAVMTIFGDDCVVQNLTVKNTKGFIGPHAVGIFGWGDRTVIEDGAVLSQGADTLALTRNRGGRSYQARLDLRGSVDFVCPHGWCYMTDCSFYEVKEGEATIWHDGSRDRDMKFVLRDCRFDGTPAGWRLGRHHSGGQFYLIDCSFSKSMRDQPIARVIYPLVGNQPTQADLLLNQKYDAVNRWGERDYYFNSHREGGDYAWIKDNLSSADGHPTPEQVTARWTFGGKWDPENAVGPAIVRVEPGEGQIAVVFGETVTVKGGPRLVLANGASAPYAFGSGSRTLIFKLPAGNAGPARTLDVNGGAILASEASAILRQVSATVPL
jgi:pectinesterase